MKYSIIISNRLLFDSAMPTVFSKCSVSCDGLMLDDISKSDTIPVVSVENNDIEFSHEAKVGKISEKAIFYLMTRGLSEEEIRELVGQEVVSYE